MSSNMVPQVCRTPAICRPRDTEELTPPQEELPILEAFINIRNRLTALKKVSSPIATVLASHH